VKKGHWVSTLEKKSSNVISEYSFKGGADIFAIWTLRSGLNFPTLTKPQPQPPQHQSSTEKKYLPILSNHRNTPEMSASASTFDSAGAKSVMSNDMKELTEGKEEITNVIRGHKANLSNPSIFAVPFPLCFVHVCTAVAVY
jgi:hypothetical protein